LDSVPKIIKIGPFLTELFGNFLDQNYNLVQKCHPFISWITQSKMNQFY